jgi:hypothetical protein
MSLVVQSRLIGIAIYSTPSIAAEFTKTDLTPSLTVGLLPGALLLACSFLLFVNDEMSDVRKAGRVEGQSVAAVLFGKMQADRFRQMDQRGVSRAGTTNKPDRNAGAAFSVRCRQ